MARPKSRVAVEVAKAVTVETETKIETEIEVESKPPTTIADTGYLRSMGYVNAKTSKVS